MTSFILEFSLDGSEPRVSRTVAIPTEASFFDLHRTIQDSMGWMDIHLHEFIIGKSRKLVGHTAIPEVEDEREVAIADYKNEPIHYNYDFGEKWEVTVTWKGESDDYIIPTLTDYQEVCPVDDCGGFEGFKKIQTIIEDPKNEEYEQVKKWMDNFPPRTKEFSEFAVSTYLIAGVMRGRRCVKPDIIGEMTQMFSLPFSGELYLDIENSKVCELVDSVKKKSRFTKVTKNLLTSDPERFANFKFSFEGLDKEAEILAPVFNVKKERKIVDTKSVIDISTEDKTEWMTYSITYYIREILDNAGLYIDYGYNGFNPVELTFRQLQNDPAALEEMLEEFRDKE